MIYRAIHDKENPYFLVLRTTAQDVRLTWNARGILEYIFSKPDTWQPTLNDLINQTKDSRAPLGRDGVRAALVELESFGYIHRYQLILSSGKFGEWVSDIHERPQIQPQPVTAEPSPVAAEPSPVTAGPAPVQPAPVQTTLINTDIRKYRKKENTEQQQQTPKSQTAQPQPGKIAAAADPSDFPEHHSSIHSFATVLAWVKTEKENAKNPRGLARTIWRDGSSDDEVSSWLDAKLELERRQQASEGKARQDQAEISASFKQAEEYEAWRLEFFSSISESEYALAFEIAKNEIKEKLMKKLKFFNARDFDPEKFKYAIETRIIEIVSNNQAQHEQAA